MSQRILDVEGAVNFRDFGGYETAEGGRVTHGRLYRSGELSGLTEIGRAAFDDLDIGLICDLRRHDERDDDMTPLPQELQMHVPIDPGSAVQMRDRVGNPDFDHDQRVAFMTGINVELARDHADEYREVFRALLAHENSGFLIHCTAGKDRTGFGVAIIQLALGVSRELVEEDYMLTNQVIDFETFMLPRLRDRYGMDVDLDAARAVSGVRLEYIHAALDAVDEHFGNVDGYLDTIGVGAGEREALKNRYLA